MTLPQTFMSRFSCVRRLACLSGVYLTLEMPGHTAAPHVTFWETTRLFLMEPRHFTFPPAQALGREEMGLMKVNLDTLFYVWVFEWGLSGDPDVFILWSDPFGTTKEAVVEP